MKPYLDKFNATFKGKKNLEIQIFNEEPFVVKYTRYNQSGKMCHSLDGSNKAFQRVKNGWQEIECNSNCQYRQKNEKGKCACNRIGWLKFFIPSISTNRIFLMRITSQTSINRLDAYFALQKSQGKSLKGTYTIFLKQEEQSNQFAQSFNNYVLDILNMDELNSNTPIPQTNANENNLPNTNNQSVKSKATEQEVKSNEEQPIKPEVVSETKTEEKKKATRNSKTTAAKKDTKTKDNKVTEKKSNESADIDNCYALLGTSTQNLVDKQGNSKEYLIGNFADMNDKMVDIVIHPEYADELTECDLGTMVRLEIKDNGVRKFATKVEFISKLQKNIAA